MKKFFALTTAIVLTCLLALPCPAAWPSADDLKSSLTVVSPSTGVTDLEVRASGCGCVKVVVAHLDGSPLPALDSIVVKLDPRGAGRTMSAYIPSGIVGPYWTQPDWTDTLAAINPDTQFALWQETDGSWSAMIPLVGSGMRSILGGDGQSVLINTSSYHEGWNPTEVPLFAVGTCDDPYHLTRKLYTQALAQMKQIDPDGVIGKLRWEKAYPEVFRYLGWCSWNSHYRYVKASDFIVHAESFKAAGFPMGFVLIDDGWQSVNRLTMIPWAQGKLYMTAFEPNDKFPGGLAPVVNTLKNDYGIRYVGVWHTFQGYWNGIALDSVLGREYDLLPTDADPQAGIPDPRSDAGEKFWNDWYTYLSGQGIDFVKVDNQSTFSSLVGSAVPVSKGMAQAQANLQGPAEKYFHSQMINCMEMNIDVVYQWRTTNIARSSTDYVPIFPHNPRTHTVKNLMNAMWLTNLAYPDYDMFKTHDQHVDYHQVSRALSGGPVYITDNAGRERFELLWPLILSDGRLLQVDEPGLPTKKSLLMNPYRDRHPLTAFAPIGDAGMLGAWAADSYERPVSVALAPSDVEGIEGERFAVYEFFSGWFSVRSRDEEFLVSLGRWGARLYSVVPVRDGFAAIGRTDKLLAPATVKSVERADDTVTVVLAESGPFAAASEKRPQRVMVDGSELAADRIKYDGGLLRLDLPVGGPQESRIEIVY